MSSYYLVLLLMTIIGSVASLFLKKASSSEGIMRVISNIDLYIGGGLYVLSALLNIFILKHLDYSVVLPLTAITYIWTMAIAHYQLGERITIKKSCGVGCILLGAILVSIGR